jgi:hypothetical protein
MLVKALSRAAVAAAAAPVPLRNERRDIPPRNIP